KVAVVMIGTNNASDGDSAEVIAGGIIAVCNKIRQKLPETKIVLMGIFPRGEKPCEIRERNAKASEIASKIADGEMIQYMDISEQFMGPDGSISKEIMFDYVHLTSRGYKIWAKALEPKLKELLDEKHTAVTASHRYSGWALRHESLNDRAECGYVDLVFIGDSITEKWETHGEHVWEKYYGKRKAINLAISGDRTQHVLWRLKNGNIDGLSPKAAVVMIGTNNLSGYRNKPEETAGGVKAVCDLLREKLPDTKILLLGIFPREEKPGELRAKVKATNDIISKLGDGRMIHYLDIGEKFIQSDGTISKEIMGDSVHLTPKGYQVWAESIEPKLAELMGE
ncbi:MAG: GDSL-type esterase/lipase family protein, partial [Planctomycetota bacterium]